MKSCVQGIVGNKENTVLRSFRDFLLNFFLCHVIRNNILNRNSDLFQFLNMQIPSLSTFKTVTKIYSWAIFVVICSTILHGENFVKKCII